MPSKKLELKKNILYLQSRRSGVEFAVDKPVEELRAYIKRVNADITKLQSEVYLIEKDEAELKEFEKQRKAEAKKNVWK